jgi:hypothetical protein
MIWLKDFSEVESFNVTPRPPAEIEVDMRLEEMRKNFRLNRM